MQLANIMTPDPIAAARHTKVGEALRILRDHDIRHLPLVEGGRLVGIVTDRDLRQYTPPMDRIDDFEYMVDLLDAPIQDVACQDVVALAPDAEVGDAIDAMTRYKIGAVCIQDEEGRLLGIVTTIDVLKAVRALTPTHPHQGEDAILL